LGGARERKVAILREFEGRGGVKVAVWGRFEVKVAFWRSLKGNAR